MADSVGRIDSAQQRQRSLSDVDRRRRSISSPIATRPLTTLSSTTRTRTRSKQLIANQRGFDIVSASANDGDDRLLEVRFDPSLRSGDAHRSRGADLDCRRHARTAPALGSRPRARSQRRRSRRRACARSSKRTATSSPCRRTTARFATSRRRRASRSAIRRGRPTASGSRISPMRAASTRCAYAIRRGSIPSASFVSNRIPRSTTRRPGRPTARKSRMRTNTAASTTSTSLRRRPQAVKVAEQPYETFDTNSFAAAWSPDSRYIALRQAAAELSCMRSTSSTPRTAHAYQ